MKKNKLKILYEKDFQSVFRNDIRFYPEAKSKHIFKLMIRYKIAFNNNLGIKGLLVPCVASPHKPASVKVNPDADKLVTKTSRDGLKEFPADFFERYIYENREDIDVNGDEFSFWLTGMVLVGDSSSALIEIIENREIVITVWGNNKQQYQNRLYKRLDNLFKDYSFVAIGKKEINDFGDTINIKMTVYNKHDSKLNLAGKLFKVAEKTVVIGKGVELAEKYGPEIAEAAKSFLSIVFKT
jgi:hypothetical protein